MKSIFIPLIFGLTQVYFEQALHLSDLVETSIYKNYFVFLASAVFIPLANSGEINSSTKFSVRHISVSVLQ